MDHPVRMTYKTVVRVALPIVLSLIAASMVLPLLMRFSIDRYIVDMALPPHAEVVLILGASVARGAPLPVLAARADAAIALYKAGVVEKVLVTGDNSALSHDEVTPVRKYLLDRGVKAEDIFLDHAGFDTYSSMYRARSVFNIHSLIITTQDFHLPRSLWIARALGLEAYGFRAEGAEGSHYDALREIPATLKALVDVTVHRAPRYLGPAIPIQGDGQSTWY